MTEQKTELHENAIYAIKHGLKRLKYKYKDVSQINNFNKYISFHKECIELFEKLYVAENYRDYIRAYDKLDSRIWLSTEKYDFPNLYHYAIEDVKKRMKEALKRIYDNMHSFEFLVTDSNMTVNDNNGKKIFKTPYEMWGSFKSYHDLDDTAKIEFNGKTYYPCRIEDCLEIFGFTKDMVKNKDE